MTNFKPNLKQKANEKAFKRLALRFMGRGFTLNNICSAHRNMLCYYSLHN